MRIAIVEDSPAYFEPMKEVLKLAGHEVVIIWRFQDGLDACVEEILRTNPELVLLDHDLDAEFDGEHIAAQLKGVRLVSISSTKRHYCTKQFIYKDLLSVKKHAKFAGEELLKTI